MSLTEHPSGESLPASAADAPPPATAMAPMSLLAGIVCVILIATDLRPGIVAVGPLLTSISATFGLTHTEASLLTAIPDVLMGLLALPTPWLARRFGRDRVVLAALIVLLAAMVARAFSGTTASLFASTAGVGAGIAIAGALVGGFIKASFPARAALLTGIYAAALATGSTLSAAFTGPLAQLGGWRFGAAAWATLGPIAIATWFFVERRQRLLVRPDGGPARRYDLPLREPKAWLIALFFAADNFLFYAFVAWLAPLYREQGVSEATAGIILASFTGMFIFSTPLAGFLSRTHDRRPLLAAFAALNLIGVLGLSLFPYAAPLLLVPVASFGLGGAFALGMTLPLDNTRDADEANVWNAFAIMVAYLFAACGPILVGAIRDLTGGFGIALWVLSGVAVLMLAVTPFLNPRRHMDDRR